MYHYNIGTAALRAVAVERGLPTHTRSVGKAREITVEGVEWKVAPATLYHRKASRWTRGVYWVFRGGEYVSL